MNHLASPSGRLCRSAWTSFVVAAGLLCTGCGDGGVASDAATFAMPSFASDVNHPHFPLRRGTYRVYEGSADGEPRREEVFTLTQRREIMGVQCTAVQQRVEIAGEAFEATTEWYAEDEQGNVWKFGEETYEWDDGRPTRGTDAWLASDGGAAPWIVFYAVPSVGDEFFGYRPDGQDHFIVESLSDSVAVPAGMFSDCMRVKENPDDPNDQDIILYARGVGLVREISSTGVVELVEIQQP